MSVAAWRIRKRVKGWRDADHVVEGGLERAILDGVLSVIDEELEAEAERQFTQRINPDPVAQQAKEQSA